MTLHPLIRSGLIVMGRILTVAIHQIGPVLGKEPTPKITGHGRREQQASSHLQDYFCYSTRTKDPTSPKATTKGALRYSLSYS